MKEAVQVKWSSGTSTWQATRILFTKQISVSTDMKLTQAVAVINIILRLGKMIGTAVLGTEARGIASLCITLRESHVAWGSYEGPV